MTVSCSSCGETWPRDPALEVPCPTWRASRLARSGGDGRRILGAMPEGAECAARGRDIEANGIVLIIFQWVGDCLGGEGAVYV
jgi:hypothetical protein